MNGLITLAELRFISDSSTTCKYKKVEPRMAKFALLLIKFMKYGIVQYLLYENLEESPNCVYIPNIHR